MEVTVREGIEEAAESGLLDNGLLVNGLLDMLDRALLVADATAATAAAARCWLICWFCRAR